MHGNALELVDSLGDSVSVGSCRDGDLDPCVGVEIDAHLTVSVGIGGEETYRVTDLYRHARNSRAALVNYGHGVFREPRESYGMLGSILGKGPRFLRGCAVFLRKLLKLNDNVRDSVDLSRSLTLAVCGEHLGLVLAIGKLQRDARNGCAALINDGYGIILADLGITASGLLAAAALASVDICLEGERGVAGVGDDLSTQERVCTRPSRCVSIFAASTPLR